MESIFDVQITTSAPASGRVLLMYWWAQNYPVTDVAHETEPTEATACAVYQWLRGVCTTCLLHTPIRLGGPGIVVQIDENLMNHMPKVIK